MSAIPRLFRGEPHFCCLSSHPLLSSWTERFGCPGAGSRNARSDDSEVIAVTNPMSQAGVPAAAAAAAQGTRANEGVDDGPRDADVPVGRADVEADARRAEEETETD
jgi:hypothetical protein